MNKKIVGKCTQCGGVVSVPTVYLSTVPPTPSCEKCGAYVDKTANLPVIPTVPVHHEIPQVRRYRSRPSLNSMLNGITEENQHPLVDFGPSVGNEFGSPDCASMIPRMILMTLIRKDQSGNTKPSPVTSILILLLAMTMIGIEILGSNGAQIAPPTQKEVETIVSIVE